MADRDQLPHILRLLDDDSPRVQSMLADELASFGEALNDELADLQPVPSFEQRVMIQQVLERHNRDWLRKQWPGWFALQGDYDRLEVALSLLADYQSRYIYPTPLGTLLDQLSDEFQRLSEKIDPLALASFLFRTKDLSGALKDYYSPNNSNLKYVICEKRGLPISLASIYMLTGHRLGMTIEGCNMPGHFLAKFQKDGKDILVDCFHRGRILRDEDIRRMYGKSAGLVLEASSYKADAGVIVRRVLRNLISACQKREHWTQAYFLQEVMEYSVAAGFRPSLRPLSGEEALERDPPLFRAGYVVRHKRYEYCGLIVDFDLSCQADDQWYRANKTQPPKDQPWYHVLVDGTDQVTYAAQSNLMPESGRKEIVHPLIPYFFKVTDEGEYVRNNHPWPGQ